MVTQGSHLKYLHCLVHLSEIRLYSGTMRTALFFTNSWGETINIKTGCGASAHTMFPLASAFLWEEKAYYACPNFFGPLSASGDDNLSLNTLVGQIAWGLGQVTLVQDSTIYANFAVFQPGVLPFVNELINSRYLSFYLCFSPLHLCIKLKQEELYSFHPIHPTIYMLSAYRAS